MWWNTAVEYVRAVGKRFVTAEKGSVSVDFVVAIPILLAVLAFTSEYGRLLQLRTALDNAVGDAVRYLARAPCEEVNDQCVGFSNDVITVAEGLITSRINVDEMIIGQPAIGAVNAGTEINDYNVVSLQVAVGLRSPALSVMSIANKELEINGTQLNQIEGFVLVAGESARHFGQ